MGVAFILFTLATAGVKGFAFTLGVGTLVSLFTAVLATSAILGSMARSRLLRRPSALGVGEGAQVAGRSTSWATSRWFFSFSGVILLVGAIALATLGLNFGIDFESGTRIITPLEQQASVDEVRGALEPLGYGDAKIQQVDDPELGENVFQLSVPQLDPSEVDEVRGGARRRLRGGESTTSPRARSAPPSASRSRSTALIAVIASLLLISLYIGFRFEWKFAVPVLIALAHDLLITSGVYALFGREVTTVDGRRPAHDHGLLALRHDDRVRPNPRERAAHAARNLLADREPLDVRGVHPIAGHELRGADAGGLRCCSSAATRSRTSLSPCSSAWPRAPTRRSSSPRRCWWSGRSASRSTCAAAALVMEQHGGLVPAFATGAVAGEPAVAAAAAGSGAAHPPGRRAGRARAGRAPGRPCSGAAAAASASAR